MKNTIAFMTLFILTFGISTTNVIAKSQSNRIHHHYVKGHAFKKGESASKKSSHAKNDTSLSEHQRHILKLAVIRAKKDGLKKPEVLAGIILQESKAGEAAKFRTAKHKSKKDQSLGLGQVKVSTAKAVLKQYPELKAEFPNAKQDLGYALANNDQFNTAVASKYVKMMCDIKCQDAFVLAAYNGGPGYATKIKNLEKLAYVRNVRNHIKQYHLASL
jgi:hypothetical protein